MEILGIVVLILALLMILNDRSVRRAVRKRRERSKATAAQQGWLAGVGAIGAVDLSGAGIGAALTHCPQCGRSLPRITSVRSSSFKPPRNIGHTAQGAEYCSKCGDPLWEVCPTCDGSQRISVPLARGEERYCRGCGYEWRQDKVIACPKCRGQGRVATGHDVARCRGS